MLDKLDAALRFQQEALNLRAQRQEILAANIANADTPGYQARDLDFASVLAEQSSRMQRGGVSLSRTDSRHIPAEGVKTGEAELPYRTPFHASLDQNTVDLQIEQSNYAENSVQFQASFTFLNSKFKGLTTALRGE